MVQSWKHKKDVLRDENRELDALIGELKTESIADQNKIRTAEFEKNIAILEETITSKSDTIASLRTKLAELETREKQLQQKLTEYEDERQRLRSEVEEQRDARTEMSNALLEKEKRISSLFEKERQKEETIGQLQANLSGVERHLSSLMEVVKEQEEKSSQRGVLKKIKKALSKKKSGDARLSLNKADPIQLVSASEDIQVTENIDKRASTQSNSLAEEIENSSGDASMRQALVLLEKQLTSQERHLKDLRDGLLREEHVRVNLERLLLEGNQLMHSLATGCKNRLRDAQSAIRVASATKDADLKSALLKELDQIIEFFNKLQEDKKQSQALAHSLSLIHPPLDAAEGRSAPVKIT